MSERLHPIDGVREDFTAFLKDFIATKSLRFRIFAQVWRDHRFSFLSCGRQTVSRANDFFNCLFHQLLQFMLPPHELESQVCAFYMLYSFYFKQPIQNHVRIRVTSREWSVILQLVANMRRDAHWDLVYIFHVLCSSKAFHFCATLQPFYPSVPSYAFSPREPLPLTDGKSISSVIGLNRLQMLSDIHQRYQNFKRNIPSQQEAAQANRTGEEGLTADLDLVRPSFFPDLIDKVITADKELSDAFRHFRNLFPSRFPRRSDPETEQDLSNDEAIAMRAIDEDFQMLPDEEEDDEDEDDEEEDEEDDEEEDDEEEDEEEEEKGSSDYWRNRVSRMAVSQEAVRRHSNLPIGERRKALKMKPFGAGRSPSKSAENIEGLSSEDSLSPTASPPRQKRTQRQKNTPKSPRKGPPKAPRGRKKKAKGRPKKKKSPAVTSNATPRPRGRAKKKQHHSLEHLPDLLATPPNPKRRRTEQSVDTQSVCQSDCLELPLFNPPSPMPGPSGVSSEITKRK